MITLVIQDDTLQKAFESHLKSVLETGNYNNPVKQAFDKLLGYNGELVGEFNNQIKEMVRSQMQTSEFAAELGRAMAAELARREVDRIGKK